MTRENPYDEMVELGRKEREKEILEIIDKWFLVGHIITYLLKQKIKENKSR